MNNSDTPVDRLMAFINNRSNPNEEIPEQLSADLREWVAQSKPDYPDQMIPPWEFHAHIPYGSIGWRMGPGEDYWHDFSNWLMALPSEEYAGYLIKHPEPAGWYGYYKRMRGSFERDNA